MKKKRDLTIEELTNNELLRIETEDKIAKFEKDITKYKKTISNLREKDKLFTKALTLCEKKINRIKETSLDSLLFLCENIKDIKNNSVLECEKLPDTDSKKNLLILIEEYDYILNTIYDVCNKIEEEAVFTKVDKEIISSKFDMSDLGKIEPIDQFAELKNELRKNISRKNNKDSSKKKDEINDFDDLLNRKPKKNKSTYEDIENEEESSFENNEIISEKFSKMFYEAPTSSSVVSSIEKTDDSVFDFNEALNPTLSLSDIMNDLMSFDDSDDDEELIFDIPQKKSNKNESEALKKRQERMDKIESKLASESKITKRQVDENLYNDELNKKESYEERFTKLQNIVKDNK